MMCTLNTIAGILLLWVPFTLLCAASPAHGLQQAAVGELFTFKIEPTLFNWTHLVMSEQFRYRPSLEGYPDLPSWMRYMYSNDHHVGFLYGTPPNRLAGKTIHLDIVALNRQNFETRQIILPIFIAHKFPMPNVIQMKIDNLNWVHMMDPGRVENLLNIFRNNLWPESESDISLIFLESAINMGGRLPLRPQQHEGIVVHLGSFAQFSPRLKELQEEVRPLYKLTTCTYKRTSVQKIFENAGFKLDWCAFKMVGTEILPEILFHNHGHKGLQHSSEILRGSSEPWEAIARDEVPSRNYIDEFAFAIAVPGVIFVGILGILSVIFCFQHRKLFDPLSEVYFQNIFHICEEWWESRKSASIDVESDHDLYMPTSTVQMVQCTDTSTDQPVTTLKSLKDPNCLLDNASQRSQSPSGSYLYTDSSQNAYLRPKPPPYRGGTLGRSGVDI